MHKKLYPIIRQILALWAFAIWAAPVQGQPYCDVHTFTIRDGLPANTISSISQSADGLMWFSTWNGLCFYDGYRFTAFRNRPGIDDVLSTNRLLNSRPGSDGSIWCITSDNRLYLFDTHTCRFISVSDIIRRRFSHEAAVIDVVPLANGHTWVIGRNGTDNYRIDNARLDDNGGGITPYGTAGRRLKGALRQVFMGGDGREWLSTRYGLESADGSLNLPCQHDSIAYAAVMGKATWFVSAKGKIFTTAGGGRRVEAGPDLGVKAVYCIAQDGRRLLLGTDDGIVETGADRRVRRWAVQTPAQPSATVRHLYVDSRRRIWAFNGQDGVTLIQPGGGERRWLQIQAPAPTLRTACEQPLIHEDSHGTVWMVPAGGTFGYFCESEQRLKPYTLVSPGQSTACLPYIKRYFFDRDRNLWFMGYRDVSLVNFRYRNFKYLPVLPDQEARSLFTDSQGRTWVGMQDGQVAVYGKDRHLLGFLHPDGRLRPQATAFSRKIFAICEDARKNIWIGTKGDGLYIRRADGQMAHHTHNPADPYSLSSNDIYDFDIDTQGRLWIATFEGGLNLADGHTGTMRFINPRNELRQYPARQFPKVRRITHTPQGVMLLSTCSGLVTFSDRFSTPSQIRFFTSRHQQGDGSGLNASDVLQTLVTRKNGILVVTLGGGLQQIASPRLLADRLRFTRWGQLNTDEGIIQSVVEADNGDIWMMRESSIMCRRKAHGDMLQYVPDVSGSDMEFSEAKPAHDPATDIITVGARGGIVAFRPQDLKKSQYRPNIVFTGVLYQGDNTTEPVLNMKVLDVPADRRNLTVYFSAVEYTDRLLVKYAYKLEGVDKDWNYTGSVNSASFNHLPAGHHRLLVKSTNGAGIWVDNVASLNIYVHPSFWETVWARLLYLALACGIIYVGIYIYILRAKNTLGREMGEMKTRFLTEIGHKLRTPLTLIGGPVSEVLSQTDLPPTAKAHLEMVKRNAEQMLDLVNKMLRYNTDSRHLYISDNQIPQTETPEETHPRQDDPTQGDNPQEGNGLKLLVVEDNDDLRTFLVGILSREYDVIQAPDGQQGLEAARRQMPDFIITDVMMPVMDGLTMVRHIRQATETSHIPIIVLSAKASLDDRIEGLKLGVDDYITKPFSAEYLKLRVHNIICQRMMLQQSYVDQIRPDDKRTYQLESPQIVDADNEMMKSLLACLEKRIDDPSLKIEELAGAVHLSRSVFYGKIKAMTGMTPVDFVRHIRMQRAQELIKKSEYPFSQIAYKVGFSDPKYFSKCFKKAMGITPSEYREKARQQQED